MAEEVVMNFLYNLFKLWPFECKLITFDATCEYNFLLYVIVYPFIITGFKAVIIDNVY